jgi:spermidine dehydrogenase
MRLGHIVRDAGPEGIALGTEPVDTGQRYDLVVIGAGISGLAAAFLYREERPDATVLLLDNNDDFGGHARRNVMEYRGSRLIAPGGTFALESPEASPPEAMDAFRRIGLDIDRLVSYREDGFRERLGLSQAVIFDSRVFPGAKTTWVNGFHETPYERFFERAPISDAARRDLIELYTTRKHYLPETQQADSELEAELLSMSWESFIRDKMGLGDDAVRFCDLYSTDLLGLGADAVSALHGYEIGPGFHGMGGSGFYEKNGVLRYGYEPVHRYPDGNHTIARHFLKKLIPAALSGDDTMEGVFNAKAIYHELDPRGSEADRHVRLRIGSMVVRIEHSADRERVHVVYQTSDAKPHSVEARHAIMSGWGAVTKHIVPELGEIQRRALEGYRYCSALYINVMLRSWEPIAELGAFEAFWPAGYCTWMHVSDPLRVGTYRPRYEPEAPTILSMYKYIYHPGLESSEQMKLGRYEMEQKPFAEYEREIRQELNHVLGPWGFDAARDIVGITVNRWGHGYNYFKDPGPWSTRANPPYETGREPIGRISFAGADAGGSSWTQTAIAQAHRAVHEQLEVSRVM